MATGLGKYLRKLRIDRDEVLRDMANKLGVSSAFLSAVENGRKKMPEAWLPKLEKLYSLTPAQMEELQKAVLESGDTVEVDIRNASDGNRELAVLFARRFPTLDEETAQMLHRILYKRGRD